MTILTLTSLDMLDVLKYVEPKLTLGPLTYSIGIFSHLNLCLATAIHNFK